jgi:GxxExxY protein
MGFSHNGALSERVIGLAIDVHRQLGPGLLESAYEECLCFELTQKGITYSRQVPLPVVYKDVRLDCGYRLDLVVDSSLVIEVKAVERLLPVHQAQMLTYLRLGNYKAGLLINFNTVQLKDGLRRFVL